MEEETIVINDLLSFIWCKTKTTPKDLLLKCVGTFYSEQFATDALNSLVTAVPLHNNINLSSNPYKAIIEFMENTPTDRLPTFVCRNLNNVPDIDSIGMNNGLEDEIYIEHKRLVDDLDLINKSLSNLSEQMNRLSEKGPISVNAENATGSRVGSKNKILRSLDTPVRKNIKIEEEEEDEEEHFDVEEDNFQAYEELQVGLIANRYQRALARRAEKGNEEQKTKKIKPIMFESLQRSPTRKTENVLSPEDTIFPSSCKINMIMNASLVPKRKKISSPYKRNSFSKSPSDADVDSSVETHEKYLSDLPTPDYKVLNVLCSENSTPSKKSAIKSKSDNKDDPLKIQYPCPLCSNGFFEEDWTNHVRGCHGNGTRNSNDLRCPTCNCYFADKKMLGFHMGYHDTARQHGCHECGYRFYTDKALEGHMKLHSPLCKNKCPFCNFKTFKAGRVREHVRSHTGEKPYKCKLCDYASTTYDILRGHIKSHSVVKEYFKCERCDKSYSSKSKLKAHEQSHSDDNKTRTMYSCSDCSFEDRDKRTLGKHIATEHTIKYSVPSTKGDYEVPQFKSPLSQRTSSTRSSC